MCASRRIAICIAGISCLAGGTGCISHDQLHLPNPAPCRITCEHDSIAPLDPVCYGYHPTCWRPWNAGCPACSPPTSAATAHDLPEGWPPPEDLPPGPLLNGPRFDLIPERSAPPDLLPPPNDHNGPQEGSSRSTLFLRAADSTPGNVPAFGPTLEEAGASIEEHLNQYLRDGGVSIDVWPESLWDVNRCQALIGDKVEQQGAGVRRASFP
jgi:hypothetical protein